MVPATDWRTDGPGSLARLSDAQSRSISPENFDGAKGGGGRATEGTGAGGAAHLGNGWKVSPSVEIDGNSNSSWQRSPDPRSSRTSG